MQRDHRMGSVRAAGTWIGLAAAAALSGAAAGAEMEVAELHFSPATVQSFAAQPHPAWVTGVGCEGGALSADPACWSVAADAPMGQGRLWLELDRSLVAGDCALTVMHAPSADGDLAVQLFDPKGEALALDLFMNVLTVADEAKTDTFIVPLRKYPTATRIVLRRISGAVRVYGALLYPVVPEAQSDLDQLLEMVKVCGDPVSPDSPLVARIRGLVRRSGLPDAAERAAPTATHVAAAPASVPSAGTPAGGTAASSLQAGLVAWYGFEDAAPDGRATVRDLTGHGHDLRPVWGTVGAGEGVRGRCGLFSRGFLRGGFNPLETCSNLTVSLWFKTPDPKTNYKLVSAAWWRGGLDASGWVVSTHATEAWADVQQPVFCASTNTPPVSQWQRKLPLNAGDWNHLVVTMDGRQAREYINGRVSVESPLAGVPPGRGDTLTVGAWMNMFQYKGLLDEVRLYDRALAPAEVERLFAERR